MCKFVESNIPSNVKVHVVHLHSGNSSRKQRNGHMYKTICELHDRKTQNLLGVGKACCSKSDVPTRKLGRAIAVGRAMRAAGITYEGV